VLGCFRELLLLQNIIIIIIIIIIATMLCLLQNKLMLLLFTNLCHELTMSCRCCLHNLLALVDGGGEGVQRLLSRLTLLLGMGRLLSCVCSCLKHSGACVPRGLQSCCCALQLKTSCAISADC
jgi:hypothetical protein